VGGERWGCRLIFDREGRLVFGIGDMGKGEDSQDASKPTGKIFRIWPDGGAVEENPWSNVDDAIPGLVALGVRNAQGMDVHPDTGQIWFTDHGPMGGDELNVLKPGANYGWPVITYGIDYNGEPVSDLTQKDGMEQPVLHWTPSKAVDAAVFVSSLQFSKWKNRLLVGSLAFEELWLYTIDGDRVSDEELIFKNFGRIRDLKFGPDGALYAVMNNPDLILRVSVP
jgi:glucose/arabinose dehydrogenase